MNKKKSFEKLASTIIKALEKRNITGHYFEDSKALCEFLKNDLPAGSSVSWGGSMSLSESGAMDVLTDGSYEVIDRAQAKDADDLRKIFQKAYLADYFFMSTNAITFDGELVNVDGLGNRLSMLIYGPSHVYIITGRNKVAPTLDDAMRRVRNLAAPPNVERLGLDTPCSVTGKCGDCHSKDCICCQTVITRHSRIPGRIHILFVNEDLGY